MQHGIRGMRTIATFALLLFAEGAWGIEGYVIPASGQFEQALAVVNHALREGVPVYRATSVFTADGRAFQRGDYIISIPDSPTSFADDVSRAYVGQLVASIGATSHPFSTSFTAEAYGLRTPSIAVYFGKGTSGGALWHIAPAQRTGFALSAPLETDVQAGLLGDANVITFPSGGFYSGYLGATGNAVVQSFVQGGNGLFGTCGGSVYGVELGLLNVTQDQEWGWPAAADLRGPIVVSNDAPDHLALWDVGATFAPNYWTGQAFNWIGPDVTLLARYAGPTALLEPYDPALMRAYGYYPNTGLIERFWGQGAAVAGAYGAGKAILTGTHPEVYPETQPFYLDSLQWLTSSGPTVVATASLPPVQEIAPRTPVGGTDLTASLPAVVAKLTDFAARTGTARAEFAGLEVDNEKITDAIGEFLVTFLDDQRARAQKLSMQVVELGAKHQLLRNLQVNLGAHERSIPADRYAAAINRIAYARSLIVRFVDTVNGVDALVPTMDSVTLRVRDHRAALTALLALREQEGYESPTFYSGVIDLYNAETTTLHTVKLETEYPILRWSFDADRAAEAAQYAAVLAVAVLGG